MGLFSTHTHSESHTHSERLVPYEKTVHEHRAPTDDSVKLLNEFKEKAIENIFYSFLIKDNIIEADAFMIWENPIDYTMTFHCKFKINGEEFYIRESVDMFKFKSDLMKYFKSGDFKEEVLQKIYTTISEHITRELIISSKECVFSFIDKVCN